VKVIRNQNRMTEVARQLDTAIAAASDVLYQNVDKKLARGSRSGKKYKRLLFQSSKKDEPEQEQDGTLRKKFKVIRARVSGLLFAREIGWQDENLGKLKALEINPRNPRYRGTLRKAGRDAKVRKEMREAGRSMLK
jgi:hypothetical protein